MTMSKRCVTGDRQLEVTVRFASRPITAESAAPISDVNYNVGCCFKSEPQYFPIVHIVQHLKLLKNDAIKLCNFHFTGTTFHYLVYLPYQKEPIQEIVYPLCLFNFEC